MWGITEKGAALPQVTDGAAFRPQQAAPNKLRTSKLGGYPTEILLRPQK